MTTNLWDLSVWNFIIVLTVLLIGMMAANVLRRVIPPLRRSMIPSSVLGGFLVLIAGYVYKKITGNAMLDVRTLEALTYHGLGLGFVAMSLKTIEREKDPHRQRDIFNTGLTTVAGYLLQAIAGLAITIGFSYALGSFPAAGLLLPMGFGQGPGQAYNWGHNYEVNYGFANGTSFGLTVAAVGFIAASVGGIIFLNVLRRKGRISGEIGADYDEHLTHISGEGEIPLSESMDKLTVQIALAFVAYIAAYGFMAGVNAIIETGVLGNFGYNTVQPLIWGFNFLFGTVFAILLKTILRGLKKANVIHREYTNNFMQSRIAGFMFDMMVVASIAAIDLRAFTIREFIVPLSVICVAGAVVTYFLLRFTCKRLFPNYEDEAWLAMYGMLTGTASTGVILLRERDPGFETPAANNLVYQQLWAIVFGFPMLLLLAVAPQGITKSWITLGLLVVLFIVIEVIAFRSFIFKRKAKKEPEGK
jgi:ESS family glutamate:Na+ symporter